MHTLDYIQYQISKTQPTEQSFELYLVQTTPTGYTTAFGYIPQDYIDLTEWARFCFYLSFHMLLHADCLVDLSLMEELYEYD